MADVKKILLDAIKSIESKYLVRNERDFAYELYSKLRVSDFGKNVEVTSESTKKRFSWNDDILRDELIRRYFFRNNQNVNRNIIRYPDLLIHEYTTLDHQYLAIEVKKRFDSELIAKDLAKLVVYCRGKLQYKSGILILINPRRNVMEVPNINELLKRFPEIEIWIVKPDEVKLEIINSTTII